MLLSPGPAGPRAHDGDTGAQSVSSRGESWPHPTGIPVPARLCPRAARLPSAPRGPARSIPRPAPAARSQMLRSASDRCIRGRVSGNLGVLRATGRAGRGGEVGGVCGGLWTRRQRVLKPLGPWDPGTLASATGGSRPEECFK